jgi:hypothetical protein
MKDEQDKTETPRFSLAIDGMIIEWFLSNRESMLNKLMAMGYSSSEISDRAKQLGLSEQFAKRCSVGNADVALRKCLKCGERFLSVGIQNRLCNRCKGRQ